MSKLKIWIINEYAGSPYHGMTYRHYYLAREWVRQGHKVTIISASNSHFLRERPRVKGIWKSELIDGIQYVWIKVLPYRSAHQKRRAIKWIEFAIKLFLLAVARPQRMSRPDVIISSPTAPFAVLPAAVLASRFRVPWVFEVRDIWPLTLIELGGFGSSHPVIRAMACCERFALTHADMLVSNLPDYQQYVREQGIRRPVLYVPNGVAQDAQPEKPEKPEKPGPASSPWPGVPPQAFVVGYAGTLGHANALEHLIEAVRHLGETANIHAVLVGDGKNVVALREQARDLPQVHFIPPVPKDEVPQILAGFDAAFIGLPKRKVFSYGVSPNKLFDYMKSGTAVIFAIETEVNAVQAAGCGVTVPPEDPAAIAEAIRSLAAMPVEARQVMGQRGREFVRREHDYALLSQRFIQQIKKTIQEQA